MSAAKRCSVAECKKWEFRAGLCREHSNDAAPAKSGAAPTPAKTAAPVAATPAKAAAVVVTPTAVAARPVEAKAPVVTAPVATPVVTPTATPAVAAATPTPAKAAAAVATPVVTPTPSPAKVVAPTPAATPVVTPTPTPVVAAPVVVTPVSTPAKASPPVVTPAPAAAAVVVAPVVTPEVKQVVTPPVAAKVETVVTPATAAAAPVSPTPAPAKLEEKKSSTEIKEEKKVAVAASIVVTRTFPAAGGKPQLGKIQKIAGEPNDSGFTDARGNDAQFNNPRGLCVTADGIIFVADENNNRIRKITPDGRVTTFAGSDSGGYRDGKASEAEFNSPTDIVMDNAGWFYVADSNNHCIRKITPDGKEVSTWTGIPDSGSSDGVLESARWDNPWSLALDIDGSMYVAERQGNRIRHIENKTGQVRVITRYRGTLDWPTGITLDGRGWLIVGDTDNHCIRRIWVGTAAQPSPTASYRVYSFEGADGKTETFPNLAAATQAYDEWDGDNRCITTNTAIPQFVKCRFQDDRDELERMRTRFGWPDWATLRGDYASGEQQRIAGGGNDDEGPLDGPGAQMQIQNPAGVVADLGGNIFICERTRGKIRHLVAVSGQDGVNTNVSSLVPTGWSDSDTTNFRQPSGITIGADGSLYITASECIWKIPVANSVGAVPLGPTPIFIESPEEPEVAGQVRDVAGCHNNSGHKDGPRKKAQFDSPMGLVFGPDGLLYIADTENHCIRRIEADGRVATFSGAPHILGATDGDAKTARYGFPEYIVCVGDHFVISDRLCNTIRRINLDGHCTTIAGSLGDEGYVNGPRLQARFDAPRGLAVDAEGGVYVADANNHVIRYLAPDDGPVSTFAGPQPPMIEHGHANGAITSARFIQPRGLTLTSNGLLVVSDNTGCVRTINIETKIISPLCGSQETRGGTAEGKGTSAAFDEPAGIVADADGNIYCCDQDNNRIVIIKPDGEMKTLVRDQPRPNAIILDKEGSLIWTNGSGHSVRKLVKAAASGPVRVASGDDLLAAAADAEAKQDYGLAFKKLSAAALTGHRRASYQRANALLYGCNLINVDQPQARATLKRLHESKLPVADSDAFIAAATSCLYAEVLFNGYGGAVDRTAAIAILRANTHPLARLIECSIAWNGSFPSSIPRDRSAAITSAAVAAIAAADKIDAADINLQLWRAIGQKDGFLPGGGISGALPLLRTLADTRGHSYAAVLAAELLAATDAPLARSLVARAAARASPLALFVMACMQRKGFGGDVDMSGSDALLLRAKAAGHSGAHELLAGRPVSVYA